MPARSLADVVRLRSIFDTLREPDREWKEEELSRHLLTWQRMNARTVATIQRDLRRISSHPVAPVKLHGTRLDLVESFLGFLHYRENVEGKLYTAVKNDFKAVKALARYRGIPNEVWPRPPPLIKKARELLPKPEDIHDLLHGEWAKNARNSYEQHLLQYLLVLDFGFGVRFPSEAFAMKVQDFDPKQHTIVIREPKKSNRTRRLYIEPEWLCCGRDRPSLAQ